MMPKLSFTRWLGIVTIAMLTGIATDAVAKNRSGELNVGGQLRTYSVHVPDAPSPPGGYPLLLVFHGGGQQSAKIRRLTGLDELADSKGFIVAYPDGSERHWNDGRTTIRNPQDDVGFISALLDRLEADGHVNSARIYATGLSNGALFAERLGCDLSKRIAGIAPVAGTIPADIAQACHPTRKIAVMQINGTADPIMPFGGGKVADFGGRGEGGQVLSVADTTKFWAQHNGCGSLGAGERLRPIAPLDPTRIILTRPTGCPSAAPVNVLTIVDGGHAWPGAPQYAPPYLIGRLSHQIDASRAMVDFFMALPERR